MAPLSPPLQFLLLAFGGWVNRHQQDALDYLLEENRVLREQLGGRRLRLTDDQRRRLARRGKILGRKVLGEIAGIVTPDTILRWYRNLIARKYDGSKKRSPGRPGTSQDIAAIVVRMAEENPRWGYTRLRDVLAAADFFTVEVLTLHGLVRYTVLVVMELKTRKVEIAGITSQPCAAWMQQIGRNLTGFDGFLEGKRHLITDRDPLYNAAFRRLLADSGVKSVILPRQSPDLNAYLERFVLSIKSECLDHLVLLGEHHLRKAVNEYVAHYHAERAHQGLDGQLIDPRPEDLASKLPT